MGRRLHLLAGWSGATALVLGLLVPGVAAAATGCGPIDVDSGICDVNIDADHIDIGADKTVPGDGTPRADDNPGGGDGDHDGSQDSDGDGYTDAEEAEHELEKRCFGTCIGDQPVTISDLASFTPATVNVSMEPDGWMIIGLPANFIANASTNAASGSLFDVPIDVRFTPVSYTWSWGDGTSSTSNSGGSTWDDLGVEEFTATATSHVYDEKGTYTISLAVHYSVDIRGPGTAWMPVDGRLTKAALSVTAIATTATSVIVDKECSKNPNGPGC